MIARLHHITQNLPYCTHVAQAYQACAGGVHWVQVRVKDMAFDNWIRIAKEVKEVCDTYNTVCIINDNVQIAQAINADGVHLGKSDMHPDEARLILGENKIIGGSANTIEDIIRLSNTTVNYIGVGPYRFTQTKSNLNPILGIESFKKIIAQATALNITKPIIAIGGITLNDIDDIMNAGAYGVAVSSAINLSADAAQVASAFIQKIESNATITHS